MKEKEDWLHAVFESPADVRDALQRLAADGFTAGEIEVRSSLPLPQDVIPEGLRLRSRVPLLAILGGLLGGLGGFLLATATARAYPLPTGGMPIVALPPAGIITFEGTAVGAILLTVLGVVLEGRLPRRWRPGPLDDHLAAGRFLVAVRRADEASGEWTSRAVALRASETDE